MATKRDHKKVSSKTASTERPLKAKSFTSQYTRVESIPILYPNNPDVHRLWYEACKVVFPREYGNYGNFITTGAKWTPDVPTMPRYTGDRNEVVREDDTESHADSNNEHGEESANEEANESGIESETEDVIDSIIYPNKATAKSIYNEELKLYAKELVGEKSVRPQMFATLRSNLSEESIQLLSEDSRYEKCVLTSDPYILAKLIAKTHGGTKSGWEVKDRLSSTKQLLNCTQRNGESLLSYKQRFNALAKNCRDFEQQELAITFVENMNNARHGKYKTEKSNLIANECLTEYPKSVEQAYRSASRYQTDAAPRQQEVATTLVTTKKGDKPKLIKVDSKPSGSDKKATSAPKASSKLKYPCTTCSLLGLDDDFTHFPNQCPHKDEVRSIVSSASGSGSGRASTMMAVGFDGIDLGEVKLKHSTKMMQSHPTHEIRELVYTMSGKLREDEIVLDGASSINVFANRAILPPTFNSDSVTISGVGGDVESTESSVFKELFEVNVCDAFPANILSEARVEDALKKIPGADLKYDFETGTYEMNIPGHGNWIFHRRDDLGGLRVSSANPNRTFVTVKENRSKYRKRDLDKADNARELLRRANFPSDKSLANLVNTGNLLNAPVTSSDIHLATKLYGGDIPSAMGKAVKGKPRVLTHEPSTATVNKNTDVGGDIFFVDSEAFLLTVSSFGYGMGAYLGNDKAKGTRTATNIWKFLALMLASYVSYGFKVVNYFCDSEAGFESNATNVRNSGTVYNTKAPDAKVAEVERRIRTIKERDRATRASVPFKLFGILLIYSILNNIRCINFFPCAASPDVGPRERYSGTRTDFKRDFNVGFGDYCLVYDTNNSKINTSQRRMEECIALMPVGNKDGDVKFYSLRSGRVITRNNFKVYPTPDSVINYLNQQYDFHCKRNYSLPPVYRTAYRVISDDDPIDDHIEMELNPDEEIPMYGRLQDTIVPDDEQPEQATEDEPDYTTPVEECDVHVDAVDDVIVDVVTEETPTENLIEPLLDESIPEDLTPIPEPEEEDNYSADAIPATDFPARRYPARENRTTWKDRVYHIAVKKAIKEYGRKGLVSMVKEISSVAIDKQCFIPVNPNRLSKDELKSIVSSSLFLKEKFHPDGTFEKLKARLVAGGHMQNRELYEKSEISSPTVGTSSVMTVVAIAAKERRCVISADVGGAYLNARLPKGKLILMRLSRENATILVWLKPEYAVYLQKNGTMVVRLTKALYGCIESAKLWYNHLTETLESDGYTRNPIDICIFNKYVDGVQCTVCVHVDDLLMTCVHESIIDKLLTELVRVYKDVTIKRGSVQQYLGMVLDFSVPGKCTITMPKFISELLRKADVPGVATTPALESLFTIRLDAEKLDSEKAEHFHSVVAMCQYLAKRVKPEILLSVIFLSTRVAAPDVDDYHKLERVVKYIRSTDDMGICLEPDSEGIMSIHAYVDASFAVHSDLKSHTGIVVTLGGGGIYFRSTKQKLNTTSSTESELVAVSDALPPVIHVREFLIHQGYDIGPAVVYQDNMSTMKLIENGRSNSDRTRHINIRFFFAKDRVDAGQIRVQYMPTDDMIADILTKPLQGEKFRKLRAALLNWH